MDHWSQAIPDTVTVEHNGAAIPIREHPFVKDTADLATFAQRGFDAHREVGARVPLRVSKPEEVEAWRKEHLPKLYQAGILQAPPATPEEYGIAKPETIPDGIGWNDDAAKKFAAVMHKHGVPKAAAQELLGIHAEMVAGMQQDFKTNVDQTTAQLKAEFGTDYDARMESGKRLASAIFKDPQELAVFDALGLGNHPGFLSVLMRLAPLAEQDSSFLKDAKQSSGSGMTLEDVMAEERKARTDKDHPMFKAAQQYTAEYQKWRDELYAKVPGDNVRSRLGRGITIEHSNGGKLL